MASKNTAVVTMRVKIGDAELEVTGPTAFVEGKIEEFVAAHQGGVGKAATHTTAPTGVSSASSTKKQGSLAQLFKRLSVKSDVERTLIAGYFLESSQGAQSFTAAELRDAIRNAKSRPPSNPSDAINKNIKKGLMMSAGDKDGKMAFVLTTDGEEAVAALVNG